MSDDLLISVEGVSKKFCRSLKKSLWYGLQDFANEVRGRRHGDRQLRPDEFWAVENVSFAVKRGECLGLIGRNGAGKTTLLRLLSGLIKPDTGRIAMRGRVGAIIALGAGFDPILTGRENIYVNASVLGQSKREIDASIDEIVDFAEIGDFIDMPVRTYSSGMAVRLGFSIASTLKPDILLLDEVLAVGDVGFRTKCYNRIHNIAEHSAIVFVSHSMPQIARLSSKSMFIQSGRVEYLGLSSEAIARYNKNFKRKELSWQYGKDVSISEICINGEGSSRQLICDGSSPLSVRLVGRFPVCRNGLEVSLSVLSLGQELLGQCNNRFKGQRLSNHVSEQLIVIKVPKLSLGSGVFLLSLSVVDATTNEILFWAPCAWEIHVRNQVFIPSPFVLEGDIRLEPYVSGDKLDSA